MKTEKKYGSSEFLQSKNSEKGLVKTTAEKLNSLRAEKFERQGRDTRQKLSGITEEQTRHRIATQPTWARNDDMEIVMHECNRPYGCLDELVEASRSSKRTLVSCEDSRRNVRSNAAFTLVELVIVIAIVIVLSVVSVPIYRSYIDKAKWSEAYALFGTLITAQKSYYSEHGNFLDENQSSSGMGNFTSNETVLGVDARGNKYFKSFVVNWDAGHIKYLFDAYIEVPEDLRRDSSKPYIRLIYNITTGTTYTDVASLGL